MFAEFNVNGRRMRMEARPGGRIVIMLRRRFLFLFTYWEISATAEGKGVDPTFTTFFNEAKVHAKPILKLAKYSGIVQ